MEGLCSTGRSPQWTIVPMEEGGGDDDDFNVFKARIM